MMWTISKEFTFEAAHRLVNHDGKCQRLHGHSWRLTVYTCSTQLIESGSKQGMVIDYADIKKRVKPLIDDYLDHHYLNETLSTDSPTSEFIAKWVYDNLAKSGFPVLAVKINETCTSSCTYQDNDQETNLLLPVPIRLS